MLIICGGFLFGQQILRSESGKASLFTFANCPDMLYNCTEGVMSLEKKLIIVVSPPACGKTYVSKQLAKRLCLSGNPTGATGKSELPADATGKSPFVNQIVNRTTDQRRSFLWSVLLFQFLSESIFISAVFYLACRYCLIDRILHSGCHNCAQSCEAELLGGLTDKVCFCQSYLL